MAFVYAVALTGSIATGKSTAVSFLSDLGLEVIDADKIAHTILNEEHRSIAHIFGHSLVENEIVNRKDLGKIVFSDAKARKKLENLLHPLIYTRIETMTQVLDKKKKPYLVDIPLFYEYNRYPIEKSLVVYTPETMQLQRLMHRDSSSLEEAQKRVNTQHSIEEKVKKANYVIDNSGTLAHLENECKRVHTEIMKDFI